MVIATDLGQGSTAVLYWYSVKLDYAHSVLKITIKQVVKLVDLVDCFVVVESTMKAMMVFSSVQFTLFN